MNALKKIGFTALAGIAATQSAFAVGIQFANQRVNEDLQGTNTSLPVAIQNMVSYITTFLYIIAVMLCLYGGFLMLTAAGDEEKVKKGKKILIQAALGLLVIFIASTAVSFVLTLFTKA